MTRSERRSRTENVIRRQMETVNIQWGPVLQDLVTHEIFKVPGKFKKRRVFGCTCKNRTGICYKRKSADTARHERLNRAKFIQDSLDS